MSKLQYFKLPKSNDAIPALGFGSGTKWRIHKWGLSAANADQEHFVEELYNVVKDVIDAGMVHIDTAEAYTTRVEVGEAIRASSKPRSEIFLTDKWSAGFKGSTLGPYETLQKALGELKLDYVDLFLIHGPRLEKIGMKVEEAWEQMVKLKKDGLARNIGVSNFSVKELAKIIDSECPPQVNQIEYHAYLQDQSPGVVEFCKKNDILIEAYCPLSPILKTPGPLDSLLVELSNKYCRPTSQILFRWIYQNGILPLTTSSKLERTQDAMKMFEFELQDRDCQLISKLGKEKVVRNFCADLYSQYDDILYK